MTFFLAEYPWQRSTLILHTSAPGVPEEEGASDEKMIYVRVRVCVCGSQALLSNECPGAKRPQTGVLSPPFFLFVFIYDTPSALLRLDLNMR